ncbi:MAG: hypothetical protein PHV39_02875 [Methanomicrobium sp.]|nr:hypothetical protein [Methanomicrobium sp.]
MKKGLKILFFISAVVFFVLAAGCTSGETAPADIKTSNGSLDSLMQTSLSVLQGDAFSGIDALFSDAKECAVYAGRISEDEDLVAGNNSELLLKMSKILSENKCVLTVTYIGKDGIVK